MMRHPSAGQGAPGAPARRRRLGVLGLLGALIVALLGGLLATTAPVAAQTGAANDACPRVEVLLLIDQSASLRNTDPADMRVQAAEVLLRSLAASAQAGQQPVNVRVAGFGTDAQMYGAAPLPQELDAAIALVQPFAERETDLNTDYVRALQFSVDAFRGITDLPTNCKRLVWFTDGAYSIDDPAAPAIGLYTTSTDAAAIVGEFGAQTCGPLPGSTRLAEALSLSIRQTGLVVQLVDLRNDEAETPRERDDRAATAPVIDRLLGGDANDPCAVPGGRVQAGDADELAAEFFSQGQIALGRQPVSCDTMVLGFPPSLVRAATVRGSSPDQPLSVMSGPATLSEGVGFVTWVRAGAPPPPDDVRAGSTDGSDPAACFVDLAGEISPVGAQRIEPAAESTTLSWVVVGDGAEPADEAARLGPESVRMEATSDGRATPVDFDEKTRMWQVVVPGPVEEPPVVVVTATVPGWGPLASISSDLVEGALLAPPTVAWTGPTGFESPGTTGGRITVTPAEVPAGSPIPDGVVCIELDPASASLDGVTVEIAEPRACHPAGEAFAVNVRLTSEGERNDRFDVAVPYTVTHRPVGTDAELVVSTGDADMPTFELSKPADALKGAVLGFLIIVLSTLVPLLLLILLINNQRRLPSPSSMVVGRVPLVPDGGAVRRPEGSVVTASSLEPVSGTRRRYDLPSGLSLVSPRTLNPFAPTVVEARAEDGQVTAVPWMAPGAERAVEVPAKFTYLVLIRSEPGATEAEAIVVGPAKGSTMAADKAVDDAVRATNRLWGRISSAMRLIDL